MNKYPKEILKDSYRGNSTNRHTTRFSKPVSGRIEELVRNPADGTHGKINCLKTVSELLNALNSTEPSHTNNTADNEIPAMADNNQPDDLLQFLQKYQDKRDAEIVKTNEKFNATKKHFRTQNVPVEIVEQRRTLPIYSMKSELIRLVKNNQFLIVVGETGSGKSTQIPQYIVDADIVKDGLIMGITQPRRVAAKSLAERVAMESGVKLGTSVGFSVRFDSCVSSKTIIKYMTDGLLVKDSTQGDTNLDAYSVIMIDEAHERSIHTDVCFGMLKPANPCSVHRSKLFLI